MFFDGRKQLLAKIFSFFAVFLMHVALKLRMEHQEILDYKSVEVGVVLSEKKKAENCV